MYENGICLRWGGGRFADAVIPVHRRVSSIRLMRSDCRDVINIGSDEMVSINGLAQMVAEIANKRVTTKHIPGPLGVRGRNSDNRLIQERLGWRPRDPLKRGMAITYAWIEHQVQMIRHNHT